MVAVVCSHIPPGWELAALFWFPVVCPRYNAAALRPAVSGD